MRRLVVNLDEDLDLWLQGFSNQNDIARKALRLYKGDITTDSIEGMRVAFWKLTNKYKELELRFNEQYEMVEKLYNSIQEMINR